MQESYNIYDLLGKIEWEGGITGVLDYGMRDIEDYDVPEELKEVWADMAELYEDFESSASTVSDLLDEFEIKYNADKEF